MKKRSLGLILLIAATAILSVGCGSKDSAKNSEVESSAQEENVKEEEAKPAFGQRTVEEYPISAGTQSKLDALETDYSKVNWLAEYEPTEGIVVSEATFNRKNGIGGEEHYLALALTNLTGAHVKISIECYLENEAGEVVYDLIEDGLEIWDGNTIGTEIAY